MSDQAPALSVEDAVRLAIRDPAERKAFRERHPMYDRAALEKACRQMDENIASLLAQIRSLKAEKERYVAFIKDCDRRDAELRKMGH